MPGQAVFELGGRGLLERESELGRIDELLGLARGGCGRLLVVSGLAGIGKTGLLAAAAAAAANDGFYVSRAVAGELECDLAWEVVRDLFADVVREGPGSDRELFAGAAALALPVLGFGEVVPGADALSPALHGLYWLTANLSERRPVFFAVDDAHWADRASVLRPRAARAAARSRGTASPQRLLAFGRTAAPARVAR